MVVYLDLIFLLNVFIDGALLLATAWTTRTTARLWRIAVSAAAGACYVVLLLFPEWTVLGTLLVKILLSLLMIAIAFGYVSIRLFMRRLAAFYLVNFAAAGGILGMHYLLRSSGEVMNGIWFSQSGGMTMRLNIGLLFTGFSFLLTLWLYRRVYHVSGQARIVADYIADVAVKIDDFRYSCKGLIDTGNQLFDPLTKTPVMVVEAGQWQDVLPEAWIRRIRQSQADQIVTDADPVPFAWRDRLRLVPYRGINKGTRFMLALKPDRVWVSHRDKEFESTRVLVGFEGGKLSADGTYQAILHPMLLQE